MPEEIVQDQTTETEVVADSTETEIESQTTETAEVKETPTQTTKPVQTPEERARFAERKRMMERPEYKLAERLGKQYGLTPEQMLQQLEERDRQAQLEKETQRLQASPELVQELQEIRNFKTELQKEKFANELAQQEQSLRSKYPTLSDDQLDDVYNTLSENPNLSLEKAFRLTEHYDNILAQSKTQAEQDALAKITGKSQNQPIKPTGTASSGLETDIWSMDSEAFNKYKQDQLRKARQG
jgi:hypothetical protein